MVKKKVDKKKVVEEKKEPNYFLQGILKKKRKTYVLKALTKSTRVGKPKKAKCSRTSRGNNLHLR